MPTNMEPTIKIHLEPRPTNPRAKDLKVSFASLVVNDRHIWRFDNESSAKLAAANLKLALNLPGPVEVEN